MRVHASCVAIGGRGVLLRGASGVGKSDLVLRLVMAPGGDDAVLVSDDQVELRVQDGQLLASAPAAISGKLEVRGVGIVTLPVVSGVPLALVVDLVTAAGDVPRLPEAPLPCTELAGISLPRLSLFAFESSAPLKLALALSRLA